MPRNVLSRGQLAVVPDSAPEVETADAELVEELTADEAEKITGRIKACLNNWYGFEVQITELALQAYYGMAFKALGFENWNAYAAAKFGELELPRSTSAAINAALINKGGISARSAAAISGTHHETASTDARKAQEATGGNPPVGSAAGKRTGADGKKRAVRAPVKRAGESHRDKVMKSAEELGWKADIFRDTKTALDINFVRGGAKSRLFTFRMPEGKLVGPSLAVALDYLQNPWPADNVVPIRHEPQVSARQRDAPNEPVGEEMSEKDAAELEEFCAGLVAARARILAEAEDIASQPTSEDRLIRAVAALRYAVGEILQCEVPDEEPLSGEIREQVSTATWPLRFWLNGPVKGNSKAADNERTSRASFMNQWQELGSELGLDKVIAEYRPGWA